MGIPAGLAGYAVSLHGLVARNKVLEHAGEDVVDAGTGVRRWRAFVERKEAVGGALIDAAAKDLLLLPEFEDARF